MAREAIDTIIEENYTQYYLPDSSLEQLLNITPTPTGSVVDKGELASPNYVPGKAGWRLDAQGNAEFQSVTIAGVLLATKGTFGGDGSDGALALTSGVTTIDLGGVQYYIKNYSSISITGTASIAFINPHANGTIIVFKSSGAVTITSGTNPAIDLRGLGATAATDGTSFILKTNKGAVGLNTDPSGAGGVAPFGSPVITGLSTKILLLGVGAGGGTGAAKAGSTHGSGGGGGASLINDGLQGSRNGALNASGVDTGSSAGVRGGGCLYIECGLALAISSTINASGSSAAAISSTGNGGNGGGGGGGGGSIVILYTTLSSNTGTYTVTGGLGGTTALGDDGGNGGLGLSLVALNNSFA